jgi:hypothetical protein
MRKSENNMKIAAWKQFAFSREQPLFAFEILTLRAMSVPAGII